MSRVVLVAPGWNLSSSSSSFSTCDAEGTLRIERLISTSEQSLTRRQKTILGARQNTDNHIELKSRLCDSQTFATRQHARVGGYPSREAIHQRYIDECTEQSSMNLTIMTLNFQNDDNRHDV
jgi:hypothetical protein